MVIIVLITTVVVAFLVYVILINRPKESEEHKRYVRDYT